MLQQIFSARQKHQDSYVTVFPDGLSVSWKPLPLGLYIQYDQDIKRGLIPQSRLEDEIFQRCVLDDTLVRQMPFLKAGIITTVVLNIWNHSGPTGIDAFNQDLQLARQKLNSDSQVLHDLVGIILMAFPYKPEEVYAMDYETFLFRLAQAEGLLLKAQRMSEPISLVLPNQQPQQPAKRAVDAKALWERQQRQKPRPKEPKYKISPVLEAPNPKRINFSKESAELEAFALSGHEREDQFLLREQMLKDTIPVYSELIKALHKRKQE